jgi:Bifunctional DNA primase/polymerase, N-terminal
LGALADDGLRQVVQGDGGMKHNGELALRLAHAGLHVFPVKIVVGGGKPQKRPRTRWRLGGVGQHSSTDESIIRRWWRLWPDDMVGIDLGKAGLLVLDGDRHADENGEVLHDGVEALRDLFRGHSLKGHPVTWTASGGGVHVYFKAPPDFGNGTGDLPPGVDVRGSGGLVIAPGSIRPDNGKQYLPDDDHPDLAAAFAAGTIPVLPAFVQEIIKPSRPPAEPVVVTRQRGRRFECYAASALECVARELSAKAPDTGRNNTLNGSAYRMGRMVARGWITRSEVERVLFCAATNCGLVKDTDAEAVRATIASGLNAGMLQPHPDLKDRPREEEQQQRMA